MRPDQNDIELLRLLLELKRTKPLHYLYFRVLIAYKARRCPIYIDRPAIRFGALYTALIALLSFALHVRDFEVWLMTVAGGALAGTLTIDEIWRAFWRSRGGGSF